MNPIQTKAIDYLSRRDHSTKELQTKLAQHFTDSEQIQSVLADLKTAGYLSDTRFIEGRIRHRLSQGYGRLRILQELTQVHGYDRTEVNSAFAQLSETESDDPELTQLSQLIDKKFPDFDPQNKIAAQKIIQKLLQRGFNHDLIRKFVKHRQHMV